MLKAMRKNTKIIIWTVVGSFILWGGFSVGTQFSGPGGSGRIAGKLFGENISFQEFNIFYRANQIFSISETPISDPEILKIQTWQSIMLAKEAENENIQITDDEVKSEVLRILKDAGIENPSAEFYKKWVRSAVRETPLNFEKQVREILRIQKFVRKINGAALPEPTPEELRERFLREKNSLALEFKRFPTLEEAEEFHAQTPDVKAWTNLREENPEGFKSTGKIALDAVVNLWGIPLESALELVNLDANAVSSPKPIRDQFAVFLIIDKEQTPEESFTEEEQEKYKNQLLNKERRKRFFEFSSELKERAALEDYIPSTEPPEEAPVPEVVADAPPDADETPEDEAAEATLS